MAPGVDQKARRVISVSNSFYYVKGLAFPGCARKVIKMQLKALSLPGAEPDQQFIPLP